MKDGKVWYYVNGADIQESNWMRYVNCSRTEDEQNLVAYQYRGEIYYRAYKDIQPGTELFVWYGEQYAQHLGINLDGATTEGTRSVNGGTGRFFQKQPNQSYFEPPSLTLSPTICFQGG